MSTALLAPSASDARHAPSASPIRLRREDSLRRIVMPPEPISAAMVGVCIGSITVHAALLAITIVTNRVPATTPHQEIAVEIVQEAPKPREPAKPPLRLEAAKPDAPKVSPPPPMPEAPKPPPVKPSVAAAEPPKAPQTVTPAQPPQQAAKPAAAENDPETLRKELADLQAQQAALKSEAQALEASASAPTSETGPLKGSRQALALPSVGAGDGDVVGYQELVFSQLAKAKGMDEYHGDAGTTGIRFEIDDAGALVSAEVAASSGKRNLDDKALDIVRRAAPFPPPPKDGKHVFFANVNFRPPKRS